MTDNTDNQIAFCGTGYRCFTAVFVLFVIFSLGHTVHLRFMQRVDLVFILRLLRKNPFIQEKIPLVALEQTVLR